MRIYRCDSWPGGVRCDDEGTVWLYGPDGDRVPGGPICARHAIEVVDELRQKMGETWTTRPVVAEAEE